MDFLTVGAPYPGGSPQAILDVSMPVSRPFGSVRSDAQPLAQVRQESASSIQALAAWAASATPAGNMRAMERAATILADDIAAIVAAADEPALRAMRRGMTFAEGEATIFGVPGGARATARDAAMLNGLSATWCELDEGARSVPCHAGAYVLPALSAEAERLNLSTGQMLERLAVAYEFVVRVARAYPFSSMRVHPHAAFATLGAAVATSLARGHDETHLLLSASGGVTMAFSGPYGHAVEGVMIRNGWTAASTMVGYLCADLAEAGVGGIAESFYDALAGCLGSGYAPMDIETLGTDWAVLDGYHKIYACCQYAHAAIEASLALREAAGITLDRMEMIDSILVETHPRGETLTTVEPRTSLAAKFSMPHAVAAAAVFGTGGRAAFDEASLDNPQVARLRRRVTIRAHPSIGPWPNDRPSRVTWILSDGRRVSRECVSAAGGTDRPFERAALERKFSELTSLAHPRMPTVLSRVIDGEAETLARPWRETVDLMMER